jgi:hypothetical protein
MIFTELLFQVIDYCQFIFIIIILVNKLHGKKTVHRFSKLLYKLCFKWVDCVIERDNINMLQMLIMVDSASAFSAEDEKRVRSKIEIFRCTYRQSLLY